MLSALSVASSNALYHQIKHFYTFKENIYIFFA